MPQKTYDLLISLALFAATLATRIPVRSHYLFSWDSAGFALGLERYSMVEHRPHPPGFILYMGLGRLFRLVFHEPDSALVTMSILGGAAAVVALYLVGRSLFDRPTGIIAALLLVFSPMNWLYSSVALSYEVELPMVIALTWFLYQLLFHRRFPVVTALLLGIAAGFRQDVLLFLGPVWLAGTLRIPDRRRMLVSWGALAVAFLAWFVPLMWVAGGLTTYREVSAGQFRTGLLEASVFASGLRGLTRNLKDAWISLLWFFGIANVMFICLPVFLAIRDNRRDRRLIYLLGLPLPAIFFFVLFFFRQPYMLLFSVPFMLFAARVIILNSRQMSVLLTGGSADTDGEAYSMAPPGGVAGQGTREWRRMAFSPAIFMAVIVGIIAWINSYLFLSVSQQERTIPFTGGSMSAVFGPYSAEGIRQTDLKTQALLDAVRRFDHRESVALTSVPSDWRRLMFYLPEYRTVLLDREAGDSHSVATAGSSLLIEGKQVDLGSARYAVLIDVAPVGGSLPFTPIPGIPAEAHAGMVELSPGSSFMADGYTLSRD